jgi:hypothetical protein
VMFIDFYLYINAFESILLWSLRCLPSPQKE